MIPEFLLQDPPDKITWNKRYLQLCEALHMGPEVRVAIVSYMKRLMITKDLSFGERKLLDQVMNYDEYVKEQNKKVVSINAKIRNMK